MSVWEERRASIEQMVQSRMTDAQIGAEYGASGQTIYAVRKKLGIASNNRAGGYRPQSPEFRDEPEPLVGVTYIDPVSGLTVTRYPARWASNALVQSVTARPRR